MKKQKTVILKFALILLILIQNCQQKTLNPSNIDVSAKILTFDEYQVLYQKKYATEAERSLRKLNYETNLKKLMKSDCSVCGVTYLFDKSQQQLSLLNGVTLSGLKFNDQLPKIKTTGSDSILGIAKKFPGLVTATSKDWRKLGAVTSVRDQLDCGSCWAFATVAFFESYLVQVRKEVATIDLAEQQLLQCDLSSGGCGGGSAVSASNLVIKNGLPLQSAQMYNPSTFYRGSICTDANLYKFSELTFKYYFNSRRKTDAEIIALVDVRPVIVYVAASSWYMYKPLQTGQTIFRCGSTDSTKYTKLNHAVQLVGYDEKSWLIKNSWGEKWGLEGGYMKISRDVKANCGIGFFIGYLA